MFISNRTGSYKMNRKNVSQAIALKVLKVTGCPEYYGHEVNLKTGKIEPAKGTTSLPNLSYKIEF